MEEAVYGTAFHSSMGYNVDQLPPTPLVDNFMMSSSDLHTIFAAATSRRIGFPPIEADLMAASPISSTMSMVPESLESSIKARIACHPRYPRLLEAYIDCQKVGAPPEIASLLEDIRRETHFCSATDAAPTTTHIGPDPELDHFMETYCDILAKYKLDLAGPFDEATSFLKNIELQLGDLCKGNSRSCTSTDDLAGSSEDEISAEDIETAEGAAIRSEGRELKDKLLRKYSGCLSSLKQEFSKKKKKGKLPKEARQTLLDWWNLHYKWPYPTEADKIALAETTGLDQKQINNWFINQRKRHWKPAENMQFAVMDSLTGPFSLED